MTCLLGKLSVPAETVQHGVEGLMFILTESSKLMVSDFVNLYKCSVLEVYTVCKAAAV